MNAYISAMKFVWIKVIVIDLACCSEQLTLWEGGLDRVKGSITNKQLKSV